MSAWTDLVKKLCKENPGKPLGAILPLAKKIYRKNGTQSSKSVTKSSKSGNNKSKSNKSRKNRK